MAEVLDKEFKKVPERKTTRIVRLVVYAYATFLTILFLLFFLFVEVKVEPSPMEATEPVEIQTQYAMLAGICVSVGECGNDQVVIGLEKNRVSKGLYRFLVWKRDLK